MALNPEATVAAVVVVLGATNALNNRFASPAYLVNSLLCTAVLLSLFGLSGVPWTLAGLGHEALGRGVQWGLVVVALVAAGLALAALLPLTRGVFLDRRVQRAGMRDVVYQVLVRIPFATVLLEEVAFRGVLYGLVRSTHGVVWATVVSCLLFGFWHVLPSLELVRLNPVADWTFRGRPWLVVPVAVVATALTGVVLCELTRRSGSLAPAMALHWATNGLGYLAAFLVCQRSRGSRSDGLPSYPARGERSGGP